MAMAQEHGNGGGHDLQGLLRDPLVLNFAAALFALERVYQILLDGGELGLWGHFVILLVFSAGFAISALHRIGIRPDLAQKAEKVSYGIFLAASVLLVVFVAYDIVVTGRWATPPYYTGGF